MKTFVIRIYEEPKPRPIVNVTLPFRLLRSLSRLTPPSASATLKQHNVDLDDILSTLDNELAPGVIVDIYEKPHRIVIAIEDQPVAALTAS